MIQEFTQQVEDTARSVVNEIHTALPAKITNVNNDGTVNVKPYGTYYIDEEIELEYPVICDVPVVMSKYVTYPIRRNDDCLIVVSEVELDAWRSKSESDVHFRYDLNSAICIPHMQTTNANMKNSIKNNSIILGVGNTKITITSSQVQINGNLKCVGNITASGTITSSGTITGDKLVSNGTITAGGAITSSGTITGDKIVSNGTITASGAITGTNITANGSITASGSISASGSIHGSNI